MGYTKEEEEEKKKKKKKQILIPRNSVNNERNKLIGKVYEVIDENGLWES
jgi:hypothetical protein